MGEIRLLGLVKVAQQPPQGHGGRRNGGGQAGEGLVSKLLPDAPLRLVEEEAALAAVLHPAVKFLLQDPRQSGFGEGAVVQDGLRRGKAAQLVDHMLRPVSAGKTGQVGLAGGDVAEGGPGGAGIHEDAADEVAGLVIQACGVGDGAGGDHPDNIPLYQPLGCGGVLHLLADGHLVAFGDKPGDVSLAGVVGHAAHGDLLLRRLGVLAMVPGGEG